jgi:acyl transferase domain-containing protein/surfactin synthase thioesterase subunit/acyl carrier protein
MNINRGNVDIAIIGLSCRFPGAATAEEFWTNICNGVESITFFSDQELLSAGVAPSLLANSNYVKAAPTLRDVEMFDASFFGYSPKDAALMDPQQRLFLEVCWEAFENAGYDPTGYPGRVGVLSTGGGIVSSYLLAKLHHADLPGQTASTSHINNDKDFLSTRVSFKLNLKGPSFTIQSACSSSLVAVHQACQNLRFNECDMMLAGGSAVRVPQVQGYLAEKRNLYSLDGHCRPFDTAGQGTIFGSGVGAVLLKPLERAIADRDHIFAVIKGTAVNNDGSAKISYTAPSVGQQSQAVVEALKLAKVSAESLSYVECHSTGTIVGDPLEIEALSTAFRKETEHKQYCAVGSVKANIGHPEQAAAIAGLIKIALILHHKQIPPSINYETPNPRIDFASSPFYVNTKLQDFPLTDTPRRAGLNSLGIGGTNAFAVLEEAPPIAAAQNRPTGAFPCLVTLSAKSADALVARVEQLLNWLNNNSDLPIGDLCYTTNVSRSQFAFRFAAPARSTSELKKYLITWLETVTGDASSLQRASSGSIAFMFSGQGPQSVGMAAELYRTHSVFRHAMDRCRDLAEPYLERGLLEVIFAADSDDALVNRTDYTQPALFAVEYALAQLLKSWGIEPDAVIGHSLGEIAAACVADVLTLEDAMRLVIARGTLMHRVPSGGAMVAIFADQSAVCMLINKIAPEITVAAINGPLNTVVSGERDALRMLAEELERQNISYRELRISNGFHSPRTEPILDDFENVAAQIKHHAPKLPLISNLTGELMSAAPDKIYWRRHLREPVRFGDGMLALAKLDCQTFLEIGPHPVLLPMAQVCLGAKSRSANWIASLNRETPNSETTAEMLVALYLAGHNVNWIAVHADASWRRIPLPTYPFQRKRHWIEEDKIDVERARNVVEPAHQLVGKRINLDSKEICYETRYGVQHIGYFSDHRVAGTMVLPTTVELEAATIVGRTHFGTEAVSFDDAIHHEAMVFTNGEDRTVRVLVTPLKSDRASFKLVSTGAEDSGAWRNHMTGSLRRSDAPCPSAISLKQVRARCQQTWPVADLYDALRKFGLEYGPSFRGIRELHVGQHEALTKVRLPDGLAKTQYAMHPAFLDACLHGYPFVLDDAERTGSHRDKSYLPISLTGFRCYQDGVDEAWAYIKLRNAERDNTQVIDIRIYDMAERPVAELEGLTVRLLPLDTVVPTRAAVDDVFYRVAWRKSVESAIDQAHRTPASWLIFADTKGVGAGLASKLEAAGHHSHLVYRADKFAQREARKWTANEQKTQDFRHLLGQFATGEPLPCAGVVYLWGLDAPSIESLTLASLKTGSEMMCRGALAILHALDATRSTNPAGRRLWIVTANTQSAGRTDSHIDPVQAPLWGLGRTVAIEYPGIWGGLIDLQLHGDRIPDIDLLTAELLHPNGETQVALSASGQRNVARFVRQTLSELPSQLPRVRSDASYLVTGGLGMLGRSVAKWLIRKGAKHLVLTGRNANSVAAQEVFSAAINGAAVRVVAADISRDEDISRLMQTISNELPPLKGVVQSAGVLDDGILAQLDWDRFAALFEPRVYGSWLLHEYTKSLELDFFVLNSSLWTLLGSAGQGNYTASSAFLDSLATHRRIAGLPATVVNWCAWSGGGLATISGARGEAMLSSLGMKFVSPDHATQMFDNLMHRDVDQIAVAVADWPIYAGKMGKSSFLAELLNGNEHSRTSEFAPAKTALHVFPRAKSERVEVAEAEPATSGGDARTRLQSILQQHIMAELGFVEPIDLDQPLNEVGLDSLRSVTLSNILEDALGIPVSVAELIRGPTINQLVDHLVDEFAAVRSRIGEDQRQPLGRRQITNGSDATAIETVVNANDPQAYPAIRMNEETQSINTGNGVGGEGPRPIVRPSGKTALRTAGKWLIAPRPKPGAKARLFCFPYAGGGLVSFRSWAQSLDDSVEVVAVEPPGRGTRIDESPVDELDSFVERLLQEMVDWLDRPSAFFGHCLGGLTMFATLCALPKGRAHFIKYLFACGVRPPHLLKHRGEFEDNLVYDMMLHKEFDVRVPPYAQVDDIVADIIRHFDTPAADKMLETPKLRAALLPTIRADFKMAHNYQFRPVQPFAFPISSFVGNLDPWVSEKDSAGWGEFTCGGFTNHVRKGSHFLMAEDRDYILATITKEFVNQATH